MILWTDAIYDRTEKDVQRVKSLLKKGWENFTDKEKEEWNSGLKGSINETDLLRIQNNIKLLSEVLEVILDVKEVPEFPREDFYLNILENTETIRAISPTVKKNTPQTPQMPINTYAKWNAIEKILADVYDILHNNFYYYCGEDINCGDVLI